MSKYSFNSVNIKIVSLLMSLGIFLLTILFLLIVPKMELEQKEYTTKQIENMITLTTQQLKLTTKVLKQSSNDKKRYIKSFIIEKITNIQNIIHSKPKQEYLEEYINNIAQNISVEIYILNQNKEIQFKTVNKDMENINNIKINEWISITENKKTMCPIAPKKVVYTQKINNTDNLLSVSFNPAVFNNEKTNLESNIKQNIQESFKVADAMHKGKIYLMWINTNKLQNSDEPLYNVNDDYFYNNKYCISKLSNFKFPKIGLLTGREIFKAINKAPIEHLIDTDQDQGNFKYPAFTWIRLIENTPNKKLIFVMTVLEKDFHHHINSSFWKILPAALIALLCAIFVSFFIFRRLFQTINILVNTVKKVNEGDISIRSNIKGNDEIGLLGKTLDNMLDSIEKNIQELDNKVEQRTHQLQSSLNEKDTLLKEIHHRVKNNLAMTIELIKIQKFKVKDISTKEALTDIQERVFTMELLHRKLYESKDLSSINIKKYVSELVHDLYNTYNNDNKIDINIDILNTYMDIEYALPCGLIINECITNSFKYAFGEKKGQVSISLKNIDNKFILKISDNGQGIPSTINIHKSKTLGLKLITTIVKNQLYGELECINDKGTTFIIKFSETKKS